MMSVPIEYERRSVEVLERALAVVPGYAAWRPLDPGPGFPTDQRYAALPLLTKQALREQFPRGFVPGDRDLDAGLARGDVEFAQTSGSTDDQVTLVFDAAWWEQSERAAWQLNASARRLATGSHREVVIASPRCVGPGYRIDPRTVEERTLGRHLYVNEKIDPASWTEADLRRMADEINAYRPVAVEGDAAYLAWFAREVTTRGWPLHQPGIVFLTYSYPSRIYRRLIRSVFRAPIVSSYGSTETGHVFMECECNRLHQNAEHCRVDFQPWRRDFGGPNLGRMLVTVFRNPWFTVLRFDVGDVARRASAPCPCGRADGLTLESIDGRIKDVTFRADGLPVTVDRIDSRMFDIRGINGWQLDQLDPSHVLLRILVDEDQAGAARREARDALRILYGNGVRGDVEAVRSLTHEASGKFRFARSLFPVDHARLWDPS